MKRIGIVLHTHREDAAEAAQLFARALVQRGVQVVAQTEDAARVPASTGQPVFDEDLDLVVAFGGDGTLLRAAELAREAGTPVLGINLGRLGFLSAVEVSDLSVAADRVLDRGVTVEERIGLVARVDDGPPLFALNDIIVEKRDAGRTIRLEVSIDGEQLVAWSADGVIVSTPTGSTAYSMSAGGPVVSPGVECMVVTPVAPHGLFARSIVVPPDGAVRLRVTPESDPAGLSADGRPAIPVDGGATVTIGVAEHRIRLARLEPMSFWRLLREKFGLPAGKD